MLVCRFRNHFFKFKSSMAAPLIELYHEKLILEITSTDRMSSSIDNVNVNASNENDVEIGANAATTATAAGTGTGIEEQLQQEAELKPKSKPQRRLKEKYRPSTQNTNANLKDAIQPSDSTAAITSRKPSITPNSFHYSSIPEDLLNHVELHKRISSSLPSTYNFEILKCLWRIRQLHARRVALQMPEGLLAYSCTISDILNDFGNVECYIMGDVTYGACCVDDFTARALECDLLIHYGHSCLLPLNELVQPPTNSTRTPENKFAPLPALYVFVDIKIDIEHLCATLCYNIDRSTHLILASTVQFLSSLHAIHQRLSDYFTSVDIPQIKPLSKGEILGCTAPTLPDLPAIDTINGEIPSQSQIICVFVADGRFHLESWMIANPTHTFYQYNPYSLSFTREAYDHATMLQTRYDAVMKAKEARHWVIILGTLGRQGSLRIASRIESLLSDRNVRFTRLLLSEIFPAKLALLKDVDCFVQIACPRLSVDWGYAFRVPVLSTYEAEVALGTSEWRTIYPQDYYSENGGTWSNYSYRKEERDKKQAQMMIRRQQRTVGRIEYESDKTVAT